MPDAFPPGPRAWFFGIGIARSLAKAPLPLVRRLAEDYGDMAYLRIGPYRAYFINHPDLIRQVLITKAKSFRKFPLQTRVFRQVDGEGLIISEGDFWLRQRRMIQPAFHSKQMHRYAGVVVQRAAQLAKSWQPGKAYNMTDEMKRLALAVICKTMFDVDLESDDAPKIGKAIEDLSAVFTKEFSSPIIWPDWLPLPNKRRKRRAIRTLDEIVKRIIDERRQSGEDKGDLLSKLLAAVDEEGDGASMTNKQVRDEVMTLFNAGHDTSAAGLTWVCYTLAKHSEIEQRVRDEIAALGGRDLTHDDLAQLSLTENVINETLRLYPPTWGLFTRQATEAVQIGDYELPRGALAMIFPWATHYDGRFFDKPTQFDPDRWSPSRVERIPQYAYLPFGAGPHVCIGKSFAIMEMTLAVATMLQHVKLTLAPEQGDAEPEALVALRPKGGLLMSVERLKW